MKVAIIGGGASGMLCAVAVKKNRPEAQVCVYERLQKPLKKLLATGNGKCNITNSTVRAQDYGKAESFVQPALEAFPPQRTLAYFQALGLLCFEENEGRVYPMSRSAQSAVTVLQNQAQALGVKVMTDTPVTALEKTGAGFLLNHSFAADSVVFACGGAAAPQLGTDGSAFALLAAMGHTIHPLFPALVSVNVKGFPHALKGVRQICRAVLLVDGKALYTETGEVQFAEYGLSGIPIMQMSRLIPSAAHDVCVKLDCLPRISQAELENFLLRQKSDCTAETVLTGVLPRQLGNYLMQLCKIHKDVPYGTIPSAQMKQLVGKIKCLQLPVAGLRDFEYAQVTKGGAATAEFNSRTMESEIVKGLYAIGEALDVDGPCGGYNLQWAWSSALSAAEAITKE